MIRYVVLFLLVLSSASALTLSPAIKEVISEEPVSYDLLIINDDSYSQTYNFLTSDGVSLNVTEITVPGNSSAVVLVTINPEELSVGKQDLFVRVEQVGLGGGGVQALAAVDHKLLFTKPGEGKLLELDLQTARLVAGERIPVSVFLKNVGTETINDVKISAVTNPPTEELTANTNNILPGTTKRVVLYWTPPNYGEYYFRVVIDYDGISKSLEKVLAVGKPTLTIKEVKTRVVDNTTVKVGVVVYNNYNKETGLVQADLVLRKDGVILAKSTTPANKIPALSERTLEGYLQAQLDPGVYEIMATILYEGSTYKYSQLLVVSNSSLKQKLSVSLMVVVLLLLLILFYPDRLARRKLYARLKKRFE